MPYRLIIFDLDGTLLDSFPWFLRIVNGIADRHGFRRVADHEIETLRGLGAREILKSLGVPLWKLPVIARDMRSLKAEHALDIPLFSGVDRLLRRLSENGLVLAMVSSDHEANVRAALGPETARLITHYACGASLFGKSRKFKGVVRASGILPAKTLCIGDEIRDLEAARKAGLAFGAVSWGYTSAETLAALGPDLMFTSPGSIADVLTSSGC